MSPWLVEEDFLFSVKNPSDGGFYSQHDSDLDSLTLTTMGFLLIDNIWRVTFASLELNKLK